MRFETAQDAMEFYVVHRLGGGKPTRLNAIVTAVDIERILESFSRRHQRALFSIGLNDHCTPFSKSLWQRFTKRLNSAGYLTNTAEAMPQAA